MMVAKRWKIKEEKRAYKGGRTSFFGEGLGWSRSTIQFKVYFLPQTDRPWWWLSLFSLFLLLLGLPRPFSDGLFRTIGDCRWFWVMAFPYITRSPTIW